MTKTTFSRFRTPAVSRWRSFLAGAAALLLGGTGAVQGQSFLHATGPKILNASNQEVILNGMNLGGWAVQEGYILKWVWPGINDKKPRAW